VDRVKEVKVYDHRMKTKMAKACTQQTRISHQAIHYGSLPQTQ